MIHGTDVNFWLRDIVVDTTAMQSFYLTYFVFDA